MREGGRPIVRHGAGPFTVRPVVRSARPTRLWPRSRSWIRAIGSAMRVVKVRDRRGPEREPAPALCHGFGRGSSRREAPRSGGDRSLPGYAFRALGRPPTL